MKRFWLITALLIASGFSTYCIWFCGHTAGYAEAAQSYENKIGAVRNECQTRVNTGVQIGCYRTVMRGCGKSPNCLTQGREYCASLEE